MSRPRTASSNTQRLLPIECARWRYIEAIYRMNEYDRRSADRQVPAIRWRRTTPVAVPTLAAVPDHSRSTPLPVPVPTRRHGRAAATSTTRWPAAPCCAISGPAGGSGRRLRRPSRAAPRRPQRRGAGARRLPGLRTVPASCSSPTSTATAFATRTAGASSLRRELEKLGPDARRVLALRRRGVPRLQLEPPPAPRAPRPPPRAADRRRD